MKKVLFLKKGVLNCEIFLRIVLFIQYLCESLRTVKLKNKAKSKIQFYFFIVHPFSLLMKNVTKQYNVLIKEECFRDNKST